MLVKVYLELLSDHKFNPCVRQFMKSYCGSMEETILQRFKFGRRVEKMEKMSFTYVNNLVQGLSNFLLDVTLITKFDFHYP